MSMLPISTTVLALIFWAFAACQAGATPLLGREDRTFLIDGPIGGGNLIPIGEKLIELSLKNRRAPVDIIINSPGGDVITGFVFISQMEEAKANGLYVRCIVKDFAASMAFGILVHCDERHVLANSFLLWHRARIFVMGAILTEPVTKSIMTQLGLLDNQILAEVLAAMPDANADEVKYHFEIETLHTGSSLAVTSPGFAEVHTSIPGLAAAVSRATQKVDNKGKRKAQFKPGQIVYISSKVAN